MGDLIPSLLATAKTVNFNPSGTLLISKNVEDAIKEVLSGNGNSTIITGTFGVETKVLDSFNEFNGKACIWEYYISDGTNSRGGTILTNFNSTVDLVTFYDNTTTDIGDTSGISFNVDISGSLLRLSVISAAAAFSFRAIRRVV